MSEIQIIESIQQSNMVSTWTEYLCLHKTSSGQWCVDIRGYEIVGEACEYENEEGELELPDEIDGYAVIGVEDGCVAVDNLMRASDDNPIYEFSDFDPSAFQDLFRQYAGWCNSDVAAKIQKMIDESGSSVNSG